MKHAVLKVENVGMKFNLMEKKVDNLKEYIIKLVKKELRYQEFWALKDISFSIDKGDRLGILGLNGAGKSTLLKIIAGVLKATEGSVSVKGKVVPLLELGAGFDPQYTGAENIYLYGAVLGYPKDFMKEKYNEIVEFSDLGDFIHVPVKNYSSGMKARLGFSIATVMEPEILILDEVLSVGDAKFRKKSEKRIQAMFDQGITVLFVSHNIEQIKRICNKAILLEKGRLIADGPVDKVCSIYESMIDDTDLAEKKKKAKKKKKKKKKKPVPDMTGNQTVEITEKKDEGTVKQEGATHQEIENIPSAAMESPVSDSVKTAPISDIPVPDSESSVPDSVNTALISDTPAPVSAPSVSDSVSTAPISDTPAPVSASSVSDSVTTVAINDTTAPISEPPVPVSAPSVSDSVTTVAINDTPVPVSNTPAPDSETTALNSEVPIPDSETTSI